MVHINVVKERINNSKNPLFLKRGEKIRLWIDRVQNRKLQKLSINTGNWMLKEVDSWRKEF